MEEWDLVKKDWTPTPWQFQVYRMRELELLKSNLRGGHPLRHLVLFSVDTIQRYKEGGTFV